MPIKVLVKKYNNNIIQIYIFLYPEDETEKMVRWPDDKDILYYIPNKES